MEVYKASEYDITIGGTLDVSDVILKDGIKIKPLPGLTPIVPIVVTPLPSLGGRYVWPQNSGNNLLQGICARILRVRCNGGWGPPPIPKVDLKKRFRGILGRFVHCATQVTPMDVPSYLNSLDPGRRARYTTASSRLGCKFPNSQQFVKLEPAKLGGKVPVARIITDPGPLYNLSIGLFIKPVEKAVCRALEEFTGHPVVMKGYNAAKQGSLIHEAWKQFGDPIAISGDASRFDAHTGSEICMDLEFEVYKMFFRGYPELLEMLRFQLVSTVYARSQDSLIRYVMRSRKSGVHNTGVGNSIITSFMVLDWAGLVDVHIRLFDNGDDWFAIMERSDAIRFMDGIHEYFLQNGYSMQLEPMAEVIEQISFCQTSPVLVGEDYIMVRDPHVAMARDAATVKVRTEREYRRWCASVAECGLAMSSGMPVFQSYYRFFHRNALGSKAGKYMNEFGRAVLSRGMVHRFSEPLDETRYSFYLAFGVTPEHQVEMERHFEKECTITFDKDLLAKHVIENAESTIPETGF